MAESGAQAVADPRLVPPSYNSNGHIVGKSQCTWRVAR
jgi:hypothetical protein